MKNKWLKKSIVLGTSFLLIFGFILLCRYQYLSNMGDESRYRPDEHQVRVDVTDISEEHSKQNFRSSSQPLFASSFISIDDASYSQITNFDDYISYTQKHSKRYRAEYLYTEDPNINDGKGKNQYFPMSFDISNIDLTQRFMDDTLKLYQFPENGYLSDNFTNDSPLLLLAGGNITFQPMLPGLVAKDVTFKYKDKTMTTPVWISHSKKEKNSDCTDPQKLDN